MHSGRCLGNRRGAPPASHCHFEPFDCAQGKLRSAQSRNLGRSWSADSPYSAALRPRPTVISSPSTALRVNSAQRRREFQGGRMLPALRIRRRASASGEAHWAAIGPRFLDYARNDGGYGWFVHSGRSGPLTLSLSKGVSGPGGVHPPQKAGYAAATRRK